MRSTYFFKKALTLVKIFPALFSLQTKFMTKKQPSYKLAILNCYLQGGHRDIAESEAFMRLKISAENLGHEAKLFARSEDILDYNPDLVICHAYQDPKLTKFPTYGTLTMPVEWVANVERFVRNIGTYDAYISLSQSVYDYVDDTIKRKFNKIIPHVYAAFSVPKTEFTKLNFQNSCAAYVGTNWDGGRHEDFFLNFSNTNFLKCYGPQKKWKHIPGTLYGGEVPFDGKSFLKTYRSAGIGLCFNHKEFDFGGIPTSRMFEIPASSALMIAGGNKLIKKIYGDAVIYVDPYCTQKELARQVKEKVMWVRNNQEKAAEMAKEANKIFNEKLSMEVFLTNLIKFHEENFYKKESDSIFTISDKKKSVLKKIGNTNITIVSLFKGRNFGQLEKHLSSIAEQDLRPKKVILVYGDKQKKFYQLCALKNDQALIEKVIKKYHNILNIIPFKLEIDNKEKFESSLQKNLKQISNLAGNHSYISFVGSNNLLYPNHLYEAALLIEESKNDNNDLQLIYSGVAERSLTKKLPELLADDHLVKRNEKIRISQFRKIDCSDQLTESCVIFKNELLLEKLKEVNPLTSLMRDIFLNQKPQTFSPHVSVLLNSSEHNFLKQK